jgi:FlaA1/EpsC-like NDP-sugar epimerase
VLAASIFAISNLFRGEYRLSNFFAVKPHARRTMQLWNVTLICLLMLGFLTQQQSVHYSRGWIVLFYSIALVALIFERFLIVRVTVRARTAGLLSAQRVFLIGTGAQVSAFINFYEPWTLGINIVGCRFLTPVAATAAAAERSTVLDRDLAEATASIRSVEPDAIFLLLPWSATETIERCASAFLALPVEIHLGPERVLHRFENAELSKVGPLASLQLTRLPQLRRSGCLTSCSRRRR